jgi:hypothetical protein
MVLDETAPMTASGQSRHFDRVAAPSGLPRSTDIVRPPRHVGLVANSGSDRFEKDEGEARGCLRDFCICHIEFT